MKRADLRWQCSLAPALIAVLCWPSPPRAGETMVRYEIPSGELSTALHKFARQSDREILFTNEVVAGHEASSFSGSATAIDALEQVLSGSGLTYEVMPTGTLLVLAAQQTSAPASDPQPQVLGAAAAATAGADEVLDTVMVTSSRVNTPTGFNAPTPETILEQEQLLTSAPVTLSDALLQMPQFAVASQPQTGQAFANLRSIGASRTLTLVDGRRHVPTFSDGTVDLNVIPTTLVARTDIVTGGASASWGSDAVAGVVNLILDTKLDGMRSNVQGGISEYGDAESFLASVAGGMPFGGGRGTIVAGAEYSNEEGLKSFQPPYASRPWARRGSVGNTNFATPGQVGFGEPGLVYAPDVRRADVAPGGVITAGPLRGTEFLAAGQTRQFGYGSVYRNFMIGGAQNEFESSAPGGHQIYPLERYSFLTHADYAVTDSINIFGELSYAHSVSEGEAVPGRNNGSLTNVNCTRTGYTGTNLGNIGVSRDNAFLPAAVRAQMVAANINCFPLGRTFRDPGMGNFRTEDGAPMIVRGVLGGEGDLFGSWTWKAYAQHGESEFQQRRIGNIHSVRFNRAVDAVFDSSGQVVCRVNSDGIATNDDPTCVPFNLFGEGSPSQAAIDYITGTSSLDIDMTQTVAALTLNGEAFSTWAGPVGVATGIEYREDELKAVADADSQADLWQTTNRKASSGKVDVQEIFAEAIVPLAQDLPFAQRLDLQLAARYTDYSSSGGVTTWKAGASWEITDQVRIRATQSRDIRAGNIGELFTPNSVQVATNLVDRITGARLNPTIRTTGNTTLDPEKADTFTAGIVYEPRWLEGFRASIDYYSIDIEDAIAVLTEQNIVDECQLRSNPVFCGALDYDAGGTISNIRRQYQNLDETNNSGWDIELAYRMGLDGLLSWTAGDLRLRLLATRLLEDSTTAFIGGLKNDNAGEWATPDWRAYVFATYELNSFSATVDWRWFSGGPLDNTRVYGQISANGTNVGDLDPLHYTNLSLTWRLPFGAPDRTSFYIRVNNLFDREPPYPLNGGGFVDEIGRAYRAGVRVGF
jgi:iron complex outermembrane receptor protein